MLRPHDITVVYPGHPDFPDELIEYAKKREVSPVLFCWGNTELLSKKIAKRAAIVGSRNASDVGLAAARKIAHDLAGEGFNVVSGYAKGVDTAAHLGALEKGGKTTIVLSYGILKFKFKKAFLEFRRSGDVLVVSQVKPNADWNKGYAMARNKLVVALSEAVVVIECGQVDENKGAKKSGTFDAGQSALDMKKKVFVLDPELFQKRPEGNKVLLEQFGATAIDISSGAAKVAKAIQTACSQSGCVPRQGELPLHIEPSPGE